MNQLSQGFPGGTVVNISPASAGDARDMDQIPRLGRFTGEGDGSLLQYSCLENLMERGAWWATVYRVAKPDMTEATQCTHMHTCVDA